MANNHLKTRLSKNGNELKDDNQLVTEFTVSGTVDNLLNVVNEVVRENHYTLKPMRYYQNRKKQQSFQVLKEDFETRQTFACGAIEVIQRKENKVVVKFDSTRGTVSDPRPQQQSNKATLERFFVAIVQRLMILGLIKKKE